MQSSLLSDYFCDMIRSEGILSLVPPVSTTQSKPGEPTDSCQAVNLSATLWASCPLHPLVHPVAQAYSAGEGLSQKPTSTVPARPPSSSSPCAPSFIHPTRQPLS